MRTPILGILTASLALAVAAPIGVRQVLTLRTQNTGGSQASVSKSEKAIDAPTFKAPTVIGRSDVKAFAAEEKNLDGPVAKAPQRFAQGDPYFNDFADKGASMTVLDVDGNGKKWSYHSATGAMRVVYDSNVDMDDWMISQGVQLEAGKYYEISADCWGHSSSYGEKIEIKLGKSATVEGMTITVLPVTEMKHGTARNYRTMIKIAETGTYYIGVHALSPKDTYAVYCDNLRVAPGVSGSVPVAVDNLNVEPIGTDGKATVTCNAPVKNLDGGNLTSLVKLEFWRDVTPIKTIDNPAPGQAVSFVDECGAGNFTWKVVATSADGSSQASTFTTTVIGPQGIPYLKTFPTEESMNEMTIIDANNDGSTWYWDKYQKYAGLSAADGGDNDWIITPPLILKAGKVYEYSSLISAGNPTAYPPMVRMCIGTAPTVEAMTQELIPKTKIEKYDTYFAKEFTVPADGLYYLGVQGCSEKWLALIKLMNINIVGGAEAEGPSKVTDAVVEPDWSGRTQNAYISFKAPTKTGTDKPLTAITKIDIMRQGIVQHTFENPTPGEALSWTDNVGDDGEYVYRIVPYNSVGQGGVTETTIKIGEPGKPVTYLEDFTSGARFDNELTIIDANADGTTYWHATSTDPTYAWVHYDGKETSSSDDYLITPGIQLEQGVRYRVSADAWGHNEGFRLLVGTAPKLDSLTNVVVPMTTLTEFITNYSGEFTAPYTGKFYVGVHDKTEAGRRVQDFHVTNIKVERIGALNSPAYVDDFTVIADPEGQPKMTFKFKAPAKNLDGSAVTALTKIVITRGGTEVKTFESPAPGAACEYTDAPGAEGEYSYTVCAYSEAGQGQVTEYLGYAGLDVPATPANIVATYIGGGKVKVTWDPVTTTAHGAVIPTPPTYVVLESDGDNEEQLGQTTNCEYTYTAIEGNGQKRFFYGIFPFNSKGKQGQYGLSNNVFAGEAYELAFLESFENGAPHSPILVENIVFSPTWSLCTDASFTDLLSADGDNGFVAQKGYINNQGRISTGKISLKNAISPTFSFYADNISAIDYRNEIAVEVREVGSDTWTRIFNKPIREVVPNTGWGRISVDLSAYKGKEIHIGLVPTVNFADDAHTTYYSWTILDALRVHNLTNKDLGINISASAENVDAGNDADITVTVGNNGETPAASYRVDLYKDGKVVDSLNGTNLAAGRSEKLVFSQSFNVADNDEVEFYAMVNFDGDENPADNRSKTVRIIVNKPIYPEVGSLQASEREDAGGTVDVTWSAPSMDNVPPAPYKETFETAQSWNKTEANGWSFVDVDNAGIGGFQQFLFPGFTNDGTTKASFFVIDKTATELGQFASLFEGNAGSVKSIGSLLSWGGTPDDWAISPELYGGPQVMSFFAKNLQDNMPEKVEVWYSTGSMAPADFVMAGKWDLTSAAWQQFSVYLPAGTRRVAIRHNFQGGILQIDDISFRRAGDSPESITLKGYNVYRDGEKINEELVADCKYTDTGVEAGDHTYAVNAVYDRGESNARKVNLTTLTVGGVMNADVNVFGGNGVIDVINPAGQNITVLTLDGRNLYAGRADNNFSLRTAAGIYIVKVGVMTFKVTVK